MKNYSLKWRLVFSITCAFILVWAVAFAWLYFNLEKKMTETLDERLSASTQMVARLLSQIPPSQLVQTAVPIVSELNQQNLIACEVSFFSSDIVVNQQVVARTKGAPDSLATRQEGFSTWVENGVAWRSYAFKKDQLQVVAAEKIQLRESLLTEILKSILYPLILTLILCVALILWIIKVEFRPIEKITLSLIQDEHQPKLSLDNLSQLELTTIPKEIQPFIENILQLVTRLHESLENEKNFSAYAAHELRSPLTAIKTNVQLGKMIAEQKSDHKEVVDCLSDAESSIIRYQNLLEQLLLLSQSEHQISEHKQIVDLKKIVQVVISQLNNEYQNINDKIQVQWNSLTTVEFSDDAMHIVLKNIIENSLKHSQTKQSIHIYQQNQQLYIQDFGIGLNEQDLEIATTRFWRKTALNQGHGLGLSLSKILLQHYGYQLILKSEGNQGLTVILDFKNFKPDV